MKNPDCLTVHVIIHKTLNKEPYSQTILFLKVKKKDYFGADKFKKPIL